MDITNYIVMDLEFNSPNTRSFITKNGISLKSEIVEIGAVKQDKTENITAWCTRVMTGIRPLLQKVAAIIETVKMLRQQSLIACFEDGLYKRGKGESVYG